MPILLNTNASKHKLLTSKIRQMRKILLSWYYDHGRSYPWRKTDDPYKILIAEIMLRRTRADQVLPVYDKFVKKYPDFETLSKSNEKDVNKIVYSLGLFKRDKDFRNLAEVVIERYEKSIPENREELVKLPGIGQYVAGAFLAIAYNRKEWSVDTNVARVFSRFLGIEFKGDGRRNKKIISAAKYYISTKNSKDTVLALIDFGGLICKKIKPSHEQCPIRSDCVYYGECI